MNTANLQLEGFLLAMSAILETMRRKGLLTEREIADALSNAEASINGEALAKPDASHAHFEAMQFPIRFLRAATNLTATGQPSFSDLATLVGQTKGKG
jgi:hypothetical protein